MSKPNLLFIMTDQQRFDALGANGNGLIHTPNLDKLAAAGANVQSYYSNCPVCVPSRCTLFTGRYPHSHRVRENHNLLEFGREIHLFRVLKQAGYTLGYTGKNHLLESEEMENFDYVKVKEASDAPELKEWYADYRKKMAEEGKPELWRGGVFHDFPEETTRTYQTGSGAIEFLKKQTKDQPFCLCASFSDPHVPHLAPAKFKDLYPEDKMQPYSWSEGELEKKARRFGMKWRAQKADRVDDEGRRHYMAVYYGMISWVDEMIGRILDELKAQGLDENTIIVFTADHGEFCFEHNMYKKDLVLLESLLHVPFLICWPGKLESQVVKDAMMEEVDVMSTILDLMGIEAPFGIQGTSFAPCLKGERQGHKDAVFAEICPPWLYNKFESYEAFEEHHGGWESTPYNVPGDYTKAIRERNFRYIWYGTGEEELYDLRTDPQEFDNVAEHPDYQAEKSRLKLRLLEWGALTEDPLDPLSIRQLQKHYDQWQGARVLPGSQAGPGWLEERYTQNPMQP
ncbi:MAG: sulfatase [Candidatus Sumerlaeia bacterium]